MKPDRLDLLPHGLSVALFQPQIAPNTGNIARLCVASGCHLHLVRPLGFTLDDRQLRRSAMDYWPRLKYTVHDDIAQFFSTLEGRQFWFFDSGGIQTHYNTVFHDSDVLVFGSETRGVELSVLSEYPKQIVRIPQIGKERCINLSTSAGIVVYEAIRQIQF